ncbi:MAG: UDP-glucose 4-epimerase GalE [Desulfovibrionaceae bacterium]
MVKSDTKGSLSVLVCGGAGYIGSHMVRMLAAHGHTVTTFDNLSTGHRQAVEHGAFVLGDLMDPSALKALFAARHFDVVMHFSAKLLVGESVRKPALYWANNVVGTHYLLEAMRVAGVDRFVFSSTAAVYGEPRQPLIDETHPLAPLNPYGQTKLAVEKMLADYAVAYGLKSVTFRYFNAAGADPSGRIGESHDPETHLVPNVLLAALGRKPGLQVFGDAYPTPDGTCVRDYVHIEDLCRAHVAAVAYMAANPGAQVFNLGNGAGFSVLEIIRAAEAVSGLKIPYEFAPPRDGDSPQLVADSAKARALLGWTPRYTDVASIIETAWKWHREQRY